MAQEFEIIKQYFMNKQHLQREDVILGIGDDCALLQVRQGHALAVSIDTSVSGVHFPEHTPAKAIAHKSLTVSLSDLAAMGAEPAWATLAATLPSVDINWIDQFATGLFALAEQFKVQIVGGDTTRGPLSITTQLHGFVPNNQALKRNAAKVGDAIFVSGTLGDAGIGLQLALAHKQLPVSASEYFIKRLHYPTARVNLGIHLREFANAAIDISDGLAADLGHILQQSQVGACLDLNALPYSELMREYVSDTEALSMALHAGDDYELCFTVPKIKISALMTAAKQFDVSITQIGEIEAKSGLRGIASQQISDIETQGYQHF